VRNADLIVVLDQGRIVERGSHAELLSKGGLYTKLYEMQFKYEPVEEPEAAPTIMAEARDTDQNGKNGP
ncbi:MAG: hypothetical protein OEZ44_03705, partial [Candidatus Bathyarchaeota archaeon]|nr:hypothetical protein [Candidatus Bathyarchaeota archaeon]